MANTGKLSVSNGYVVYERGADSKSPLWKNIYNRESSQAWDSAKSGSSYIGDKKTPDSARYARSNVQKDLEAELATNISNLLFDDWVSIGGEDGSSIRSLHVLDLDDISVPLSSF